MAKGKLLIIVVAGAVLTLAVPVLATQSGKAANFSQKQVERGRYLVRIAGCNDCHTTDYAMQGGEIPESLWLTGDSLGWRGPWGTTYPINIRLFMVNTSQEQWLKLARTQRARPPMPWYALQGMTESDLRAIYAYIRHLGPSGEAAPSFLPPGEEPKTPYVLYPRTQ
jgi:mono/diheme cytochrome c family protein